MPKRRYEHREPTHDWQQLRLYASPDDSVRLQKRIVVPAAFARCIMESLVLLYREVFHQINELIGAIMNGVQMTIK